MNAIQTRDAAAPADRGERGWWPLNASLGAVRVALIGLCTAAALLLAACSVATPTAGSAPPRTTTTAPAADPTDFPEGDGDRAGLVDIGDGREMYLECSGTGAPTVVFISGAGVAADNWRYTGDPTDASDPASPAETAVFPETAAFTTACAYDRPGTEQMEGDASRSTAVPQPTTSQGDAADLHAMLTAAGVAGPYVLVGHSWGGMIAVTFARTYPAEVAGLVLVDAGSQYLQNALPPDVWERWMRDIAAAGEQNPDGEAPDYPKSIAALDATAPLPATVPVVVLSADRPFDYLGIGDADAYWANWLDAAAQLSASFGAPHVTATSSGHFVGNENPALVVKQICSMVPTC
ncbi:alpha/beta fold hydrolase [Agromyces sp. Marseille-P2726]|uniref:alpha/beta fold hydrolase n=1 Tax=Agromyces sp. Marseille-P2726 TaxID=2709132 RepID=UPI001C2D3090|nr:alpha/beta hydrolase [Agromyces sp. Marseille-P2726]